MEEDQKRKFQKFEDEEFNIFDQKQPDSISGTVEYEAEDNLTPMRGGKSSKQHEFEKRISKVSKNTKNTKNTKNSKKSRVFQPNQDGEERIIDKANPITNIPNAVMNFFLVNKDSAKDDIESNLSIDTSPTDTNIERIYRIFLVAWFLHAIFGAITLFMNYQDHEANSKAYKYIFIMTFKWFLSGFLTLFFLMFIALFFRVCLGVKSFGEYIGVIYMLFSLVSSFIIFLAIPLGIRAIYISPSLDLMSLLFIQVEIILDTLIIAVVIYNMIFSNSRQRESNFYSNEDEEKGIKDVLSGDNLEKLQKEILMAYENNEILNVQSDRSRENEQSPERTFTESSDRRKKDQDDRNSLYPISEIEGEKSVAGDFNASLRNEFLRKQSRQEKQEGRRTKEPNYLDMNDIMNLSKNHSENLPNRIGFSKSISNHLKIDPQGKQMSLMENIQKSKIQEKEEEDERSESINLDYESAKANSDRFQKKAQLEE
ncbi:unnamed protein product [Moneuplotes crassus]|uniref:Transmembrane protein n=2 Tax=Euplotes crassus TaxID=5936 RepID=A0AAD1UFM4_EUPCR|nr:unnamed protein product [Moneuplotes crassus]